MGHGARLTDARAACADVSSNACEPFLAEAVAVTDVFHWQAKVVPGQAGFAVVFQSGQQERCTEKWFGSLNGQALLHATLGLQDDKDAQNIYWTEALMKTVRSTCHL